MLERTAELSRANAQLTQQNDFMAALHETALGLMNRFAITALFVVDDRLRPAGLLHMHDCLRAGIA